MVGLDVIQTSVHLFLDITWAWLFRIKNLPIHVEIGPCCIYLLLITFGNMSGEPKIDHKINYNTNYINIEIK